MAYVARKAVLVALEQGRKLSQLNCTEFMVEDMRTVVSHLKDKYEDKYTLRTQWIRTPARKARIKEYWLEAR